MVVPAPPKSLGFNLALPEQEMFLKVIAKRVVRKSELVFIMLNATQYSGWPTGLDQEWLQITDRKLNMHILSIANMVSMEETGSKFYELDFSPEEVKKFDTFTSRFRQLCEAELRRVGDSAYYRTRE